MAGRQSLGTNLFTKSISHAQSATRPTSFASEAQFRQKWQGLSNLLASVEKDKPSSNGQERQEELAGDGQKQGEQEERRDRSLAERSSRLNDRQGEDADDQKQEVLEIIHRPPMRLEGAQGVDGREGGLQRRDGRSGR